MHYKYKVRITGEFEIISDDKLCDNEVFIEADYEFEASTADMYKKEIIGVETIKTSIDE